MRLFYGIFQKELFEQHIGKIEFIQDNESKSTKGALRGLHFQKGEYLQAKLVRALKGCVLDVVVDIRKDSPTRNMAYGLVVLSEETVFSYKVDNIYLF